MKKLYHKKHGWLTIKGERYSPVGNRIVTMAVDSKGIERELDGTEITKEEYDRQQEELTNLEIKTKKNESFDESLRTVFSHMKLVKGAKGEAGKDGKTPVAGVDYYSKKQVELMVRSLHEGTTKYTIQKLVEDIRPIKGKDYFDGKDGYTPKYGKDYFTKKDIDSFISEITYNIQKTVKNGKDGKDGKEGKSLQFKWEGTKLLIRKDGGEWEGKDLKGLDGLNGGGGGIHKIEDATDVNTKNVEAGQALVWNGSQWVPGGAGGGDVNSVNGQTGEVVLDYEDVGAAPELGEDDNYVTDAEKTKLNGIEEGADVTDATNVATAGALMDGDFTSNGLLKRTAEGVYGIADSADYVSGFADPNADRIVFWDDSANAYAALSVSTGLTLSNTSIIARAATESLTGISEQATILEAGTGTDSARFVTPQGVSYFQAIHNSPFNINILPSVASNNLVISLKNKVGSDHSSTNRAYAVFPGSTTVRSITSAFSRTFNAGTNYLNLGSSELATKEVDLFVSLVYNTNISAVDLILTRVPYGDYISDYVDSLTDEKGYLYSGTKPALTDTVIPIGRFAATLSAGAGYTWTVPTFTSTNLRQVPTLETRWLDYVPTVVLSNGPTSSTTVASYKITSNCVDIRYQLSGTANGSNTGTEPRITIPISNKAQRANTALPANAIWSDDATFVEGPSRIWWWSVGYIAALFPTATRKPSIISLCAFYEI